MPPGRGWVKAAHGRMPLPAPATAELLKGVPLAESDVEMELTTPTGAAILTTVVERVRPAAGDDHRGDRPGRRHARAARPGEHPPPVRRPGRRCRPTATASGCWRRTSTTCPARSSATRPTQLMAAGALDAFVTPIQMKKNRPGVMVIGPLRRGRRSPTMEEILFRETTTLGVRRYPVSRHKLKRQADRGRDAVRPGQGEARLARRPAADVQPRVRRLRPGRRRARASRSARSTTPPTPPTAARPRPPATAPEPSHGTPRSRARPLARSRPRSSTA